MSKTDDRALIKETKTLINEVEAGQTDHAAWVAIQDRVQRLAEGRTQTEVGKLLGKQQGWVSEVLNWNRDRDISGPHGGASGKNIASRRSAAKRMLRDPEQRKQVIADLSPGERAEVARVTEEVRAEAEEEFDAGRPAPKKRADWGGISARLYSARRGAEQSLNELRRLGRDQLDDEIADDLLDQAERTVGAYELLAAFLRGRDTIEDIERFLAEQEV